MDEGFLLINKKQNITSYSCIAHIKKIIESRGKIGHAGTLDPLATGLLIIGIGRSATKHFCTLLGSKKTYIVQGKLGELTDTYDCTGTVIEKKETDCITQQSLKEAIKRLGTSYEQIPPIYSALKHQGEPLYKLAREKKITQKDLAAVAEQKKRIVHLDDINLIDYRAPYFTIRATVSHGTYVRVLINDIAKQLNSCATTYSIERTAIGDFLLDQSKTLSCFNTVQDLKSSLISVKDFLATYHSS